jgi:hypothetical protein
MNGLSSLVKKTQVSTGPMPRTYRKDSLIVFFLLAITFAFFYQDADVNGNSRFSLIFASVQEGRLSIDDYYNKPGTKTGNDKAYYEGHYYSDKAIGPAVIGAILYEPLYQIQQTFHHPSQNTVKMILTFLIIGLPSAIAGTLMFILCLYLSGSRFRSYVVTLSVTLGTMYLPYSLIFFSHQFTASLLFSAFFMIFFLKEKPAIRKGWYLFLIGLLLGFALIGEYPAAVIILAFSIYYLSIIWRNHDYRHWHSVVLPLLGAIIPIMLQLLNNKLSFGGYFSIGYSNLQYQQFSTGMSQGIAGISWPNLNALYYMTMHPTLGLFWQSPVLLLAFIGAGFMFAQRHYREEAILAACIICSYFVILSGYYMWWGGYAVGARHIIPALPFFCLFLVFVPKKLNWPFVGLGLVSIGQMMIVAASTTQVPDKMVAKLSTMGFFGYSNIYDYCLKQLTFYGNFTQNLGHLLLHLNTWTSLIPLCVVIAGLTIFFFWNELKALLRLQRPSRNSTIER